MIVVVKLWTNNKEINNYRISSLRKNLLCNLYTFCCISLDAFSQNGIAVPELGNSSNLQDLSPGHQGYAWLYHFVEQWNLPFSSKEMKDVCRNGVRRDKSTILPARFSKRLSKGICPWDQSSVDFEGPVQGLVFTCYLSSTNTSVFHLGFPVKIWPRRPIWTVSLRFCVF